MDTYSMVCICGAPPEQHAGKDHPFVEKRPAYDPATWRRELASHLLTYGAPGQLYIQVEDRLRVLVFNSVAGIEVDVSARILEGNTHIVPMRNQNFPTANRALNTFDIDLTEGYLLDLCISTPTAGVKRGQCFVTVELIRATGAIAFVDHCLLSDYVVTSHALAWPGARIQQSVESTGVLRSITGTTPGAGLEISETVPTGARWQLYSIRWTLTASATVATRFSKLIIDDGVNALSIGTTNNSQTAGSVQSYLWANGISPTARVDGDFPQNLQNLVFLAAGYRLRSATTGLQAGDQYTAPQYQVMEWLEP